MWAKLIGAIFGALFGEVREGIKEKRAEASFEDRGALREANARLEENYREVMVARAIRDLIASDPDYRKRVREHYRDDN
jgi:hypothetical protein